MRFDGRLTSWNDERGFGFIEPDQGGDTVFVHVKAIVNRDGRPQVGQRFSFEVAPGPQGRKRALKVLPLRAARPVAPRRASPAPWGTATLFVLPGFLAVYLAVAALWRPPAWPALVYLGASVVTFAVYAIDKAAATRRNRRTPEKTLHLLALAGGWPGALLAQQWLRHKSVKAEFRAIFWVTVVCNIVVFVVACSPLARPFWARL